MSDLILTALSQWAFMLVKYMSRWHKLLYGHRKSPEGSVLAHVAIARGE